MIAYITKINEKMIDIGECEVYSDGNKMNMIFINFDIIMNY